MLTSENEQTTTTAAITTTERHGTEWEWGSERKNRCHFSALRQESDEKVVIPNFHSVLRFAWEMRCVREYVANVVCASYNWKQSQCFRVFRLKVSSILRFPLTIHRRYVFFFLIHCLRSFSFSILLSTSCLCRNQKYVCNSFAYVKFMNKFLMIFLFFISYHSVCVCVFAWFSTPLCSHRIHGKMEMNK